MNKSALIEKILSELERVHQIAIDAAQRAYDTATDDENEAENKYDTLGLEASYLAHGQSQRVDECEADLIAFKKLKVIQYTSDVPVSIGALVQLHDELNIESFLFISPVAGGLKMQFDKKEITLVTPSAPIGKAVLACRVGDEFEVEMGVDKKLYQLTSIY